MLNGEGVEGGLQFGRKFVLRIQSGKVTVYFMIETIRC